jgi:glutaredoxin
MKGAVLVLLAIGPALPAAAEIYKWTDSTGKVHYTDKPPADAVKKQEMKIDVQSFGGPPEIVVPNRKPGSEAPRSTPLVMYATSWCGYCRKARAYLAQKAIPYREIDIEASAANHREYKSLGGRGVPFFVAGDRKMRGFNAEAMDRFLTQR